MARKSLQEMSGIASTIARSGAKPVEKVAKTSAPALGALQGSLAAIREIDPNLIDDWGPVDRLDEFTDVNSEDDGEGFDVDAVQMSYDERSSLGMINMYERAELIGGNIKITSAPGNGTRIRLNVPVARR